MNSVENTINLTPEENAGVVSSLSDIKARLAARRERDLTKLPKHFHEALGTVHIAFFPSDGYHEVESADAPNEDIERWHPDEQKKFRDRKRDRAFLKWGVVTGDNKRLDDEVLELLLNGDFGAENKKLISAIYKQNPPREQLVQELRVMQSFNKATVVLFRILARAGSLDKLRDFMLADESSEECKALASDLRKWEDTLPAWEVLFEIEDSGIAQHFGIEVYDRMKKEAGQNEPTE